ncbi:MAG: UbiA family prenyltransferase [Candidatus Heimdallarchaeota archaeon]|nr:MAG: UbiA family prenyltransferase [Candidatus Heimdallarchaeota archaeon]
MALTTRFKDYFDLFRFSLGILCAIAVLIAGFIVHVIQGGVPDFVSFLMNNGIISIDGLVLGMIATLLLASAIEAINDVYDVETDIANKRFDRPIARGAFTPEYVRNLCITFFLLSIVITVVLVLFYRVTAALIFFILFFIIIGVGYNYVKRSGFIGNMWVSIGYVAPLFIGFFLLGPQNDHIIAICLLILAVSFLLATGREIVKDIQDYEGDLQTNYYSLAVRIGPKGAAYIAMVFFAVTVVCAIIVGVLVYNNLVFWLFLLVLAIILGLTSFTIITEPPATGGKKARKYTRWSLWWALGAFFIGVFFIP